MTKLFQAFFPPSHGGSQASHERRVRVGKHQNIHAEILTNEGIHAYRGSAKKQAACRSSTPKLRLQEQAGAGKRGGEDKQSCRLEKFPSRNLASGAPEKCMFEAERSEAEFCTFQRSEPLMRRKFFRATVFFAPLSCAPQESGNPLDCTRTILVTDQIELEKSGNNRSTCTPPSSHR